MPVLDVTDLSTVSPSKRARTETKPEDEKYVLRFSKLSDFATTPTRGSAKAAGYDLYSAYDYSIGPLDKAIVKTDIQIAVPHGCYGRVAPRSGLAAKHFIDVGAGVVDEDYRGNVGVVLFNFGKETFEGDQVTLCTFQSCTNMILCSFVIYLMRFGLMLRDALTNHLANC
uniref:Deoxyuridine 5'-triphosphate nucleotidohydrolase n=1 Tax=Xiphophorus couchianus TaxID=32473 RepID=A0A3B5MXE3_9TELE